MDNNASGFRGQSGGGGCCCAPPLPQFQGQQGQYRTSCIPNRLDTKPLNRIPLRCGADPKKYCGCTQNQTESRKRLANRRGVTFCKGGCCGAGCAGNGQPHAQYCPPAKCRDDSRGNDRGQNDRGRNDRGYGDNRRSIRRRRYSSSSAGSCDVCEHGVKFPGCHSHSPTTIIEREKPVITVHNTELCACESKWKLIERWQEAAKKREAIKRREECERYRERAKERKKKRMEEECRHQECLLMQEKLDRRRRREEEEWRQERLDMEERRLDQEYEMWLEDLLAEEAAREAKECSERRKEARRWREEQNPKRTGDPAIPELDDLKRVLAPIDPGPHEIFEYFVVEPKEPPPKPEAIAKALMGMRCSDGIHISLGDKQKKNATLRVNMGPCCKGNTTCPAPLISPEVIQMMMKVKNATNNPCLGFNQTSPPWTKLQGQISLPVQVAPTLAPFYGSPAPPPQNSYGSRPPGC